MATTAEQKAANEQYRESATHEPDEQQSREVTADNSKVNHQETPEPPQKKRKLDPDAMPSAKPSQIPDPNSKNQQKKAKRKQEWEDMREARKVKRKEKTQAKKARTRERKQAEAEAGPQDGSPAAGTPVQADKAPGRAPSVTVPVTIVVDCQFDDYMTEAENISLGSQLTRCYADNRRAKYRVHLAVSSFGGFLKDRFEGLLMGVYKNWVGVRFCADGWIAVSDQAKGWMHDVQKGGKLVGALSSSTDTASEAAVNANDTSIADADGQATDKPSTVAQQSKSKTDSEPTGETVYLTSDSPNTLSRLSPYSTYVIGGIVDKNRHKGICYKLATEAAIANPGAGIKTAKLPIGEYLAMESRKVLTTNHVNEIMLKWLELGDWGEAFMAVIPKRKGGELIGKASASAEHGHEEAQQDRDLGADVHEQPGPVGQDG